MAKKKAAKKSAKKAAAKPHAAAKKAVKKAAKKAAAKTAKKAAKRKAVAKVAARPNRATAKPPKKAAKKAVRKALPTSAERLQAEAYAKAVTTFQAGKIKRALDLFEKVAEGPDSGLRHRAHVHIQICRRRTESVRVVLKTAEDHYNYAVKLINDRRIDEARTHLDKALKKASRAGYIHYAKAVAAALGGDRDDAFRSLNRAVELDPKHRLQARRDPDMAAVRDDGRIAELLEGDSPAGDA